MSENGVRMIKAVNKEI